MRILGDAGELFPAIPSGSSYDLLLFSYYRLTFEVRYS
jgi:hypothetical protein